MKIKGENNSKTGVVTKVIKTMCLDVCFYDISFKFYLVPL